MRGSSLCPNLVRFGQVGSLLKEILKGLPGFLLAEAPAVRYYQDQSMGGAFALRLDQS